MSHPVLNADIAITLHSLKHLSLSVTHLPYLIKIWQFRFLKEVLFVTQTAEMVTGSHGRLGMNVQLLPPSDRIQETRGELASLSN